ANSYTVVYRTLDMYQNLLGHKIDWSFEKPQLTVFPHKQEGQNAYYSRWEESVNFFYFNSKPLNKTVQTSESEDVVSHETGHAVLDSLRPNYMGGFGGTETGAFHEAFGDITAMLLTLKDENSLKGILAENGGDFRKESMLSRLAEEFGKAIHLDDGNPADANKIYLRSAINNFTYKDPSTLPSGRDDNKLTSEVHNFSRLFTASVYDVLEGAYKQNLGNSSDQLSALKTAGDDVSKIFARSIELAPTSQGKYKDVAQAMLKADQEITGGKYQDVMKKVFTDRKIINKTDLKAEQLPDMKIDKPLSSKDEAVNFINQNKDKIGVNLPADVKVDSLYTNKNGETFVNYSFAKEVPVKGDGLDKYKDYVTSVYGGLSLAFDSQGKLMSLTNDPVDKVKIKDAMDEIKAYDQANLIMKTTKLDNVSVQNAEGERYRAACIPTKGGKKVIQKLPVVD
ncbi:MAG: M36 family metallopeptidase, partial [Firmicutes bacterium]|nr:M36 family metallopeptidase [Bacillota bacterium]